MKTLIASIVKLLYGTNCSCSLSLSAFCFVQGMFHSMHRMPTLQMSYYRHNHDINLELECYHLFLGQSIPIFMAITKMILTKAEYHYFPELQATSVQMAANTPDFVQLLRIRFTFLVKFSIKKIKCTGGRELINQKNTVSAKYHLQISRDRFCYVPNRSPPSLGRLTPLHQLSKTRKETNTLSFP
jgi:hypothetical protein